jgi:signal transduction histidine kinase
MQAISLSVHGFMPHGMCYLWRPEILWLHVGSDAVTALAYVSIPAAMIVFARRRPDLAYRPVVWLFTAFLVLCAATHLMSIWTVWTPHYQLEGALKALTAAVSLATAIALWPLLPRALALPSRDELETANAGLRAEVDRRAAAEAQLTELAGTLERRVARRTEELERANAALRQFSSAASHDLRAPARHMSVFAEMLEREAGESLSKDGRDLLARIRQSSTRMQTLIDGLLEYARLAHTPPDPQPVGLTDIARRAVETHQPAIEASGARVSVEPLPRALADPTLAERVFDNLIANALKHGGDKPVITVSSEPGQDGFVRIAVADNGRGVPADQAETIFGMLNRLSAETEGLGAGLAFTRTIVESHGGTITLDTAYEAGARFVFTLPAVD